MDAPRTDTPGPATPPTPPIGRKASKPQPDDIPVTESRLPGFYELNLEDRLERLQDEGWLDDETTKALLNPVPMGTLSELSENVIGRLSLPLGVATNFTIDGTDVLVPMATEETSVVAAASHGAKAARQHGGFTTTGGHPTMIAQVHLLGVDAYQAQAQIDAVHDELLETLRDPQGSMEARGGGPRTLETRVLHLPGGDEALTVHIHADVQDAMGANYVNGLAETLAPHLAHITGGRPLLRILSNLATQRIVTAKATFDRETLGGDQTVHDIVTANRIAQADAHRAATHNKGILNGITAVVLATGNDTRAVEAAAHAYAARKARYGALTDYHVTDEGHLEGRLELPLPVGTVGGATSAHPQAQAALSLLRADTAQRLSQIAAAVGLAQNVAALRALVDEGIQEGHMSLHAVNLARQAGVPSDAVQEIADAMVERDELSASAARRLARERGVDLDDG